MEELRLRLRKHLYDTRTRRFVRTNDVLAGLTLLSIVNFVLSTMPELSAYTGTFLVLEWFFVAIFLLEYIARILAVDRPMWYIFSLYGMIDLFSFLPTILGFGNFAFLKSARVLRIMQMLRLIRIAKIRRMDIDEVEDSMSVFSLNVLIYFTAVTFSLLFVGSGIYYFEYSTGVISSIPAGMLGSLTVFLDGFIFTYPESSGGVIMLGVARFFALVLFGVLIGIMGNVMKHYLYNEGLRRKSLFMR